MDRQREKGFSLLELLIVVAIILIIATIAIPSLLKSRQTAHESAAVGTLKTVNTAEISYTNISGGVYATLSELVVNGLLDSRFGNSATVSGYGYSVDLAAGRRDYTIFATAITANEGRYDYYTGPDYVIRFATITSRAPVGFDGQPVQ